MRETKLEYYENKLVIEFKDVCGFCKQLNICEELKNTFPALLFDNIIFNCDTDTYGYMTISECDYSNEVLRKCHHDYKEYIKNILTNNLDFKIDCATNKNFPINFFGYQLTLTSWENFGSKHGKHHLKIMRLICMPF